MPIVELDLQPDDDDLPYLKTRCLRAQEKGRAAITCTKAVETKTHWIGFRTLPCLGKECPACADEQPTDIEAYLSLMWASSKKHEIIRIRKPALLQLKFRTQGMPDLRGLKIELERTGERANGRVVITVFDELVADRLLPDRPDVRAHLWNIWRLDGIRVGGDEKAYIIQFARESAKALAERKAKREAENNLGGGASEATGPV